MPTPFPGMDPYLERRGLWEEVHASLIVEIQQFLTPLVRPRYRVAIERRTYLTLSASETFAGKPDVLLVSPDVQPISGRQVAPVVGSPLVGELPMPEEITERYLEVRDLITGDVVTVIELLSPTNKLTHEGRTLYQRKRANVFASITNLVEIDLLRAGEPFPVRVQGQGNYRIIVSRAPQRPRADVYLFSLREAIPTIPIPLRPGEVEPLLPLNQILHDLYDRAGYDLAVDYQQPPDPPLSTQDMTWLAEHLRAAGVRQR